MYIAFCDGSSTGRIGKAAAACVVFYGNKGVLIAKPLKFDCGNNVAELAAVYLTLQQLPDNATVTLYTDSKNVIGWLFQGWKRNNPLIDRTVKQILELWSNKNINLTLQHVKGHNGNFWNERCDHAANEAKKTGKIIMEDVTR